MHQLIGSVSPIDCQLTVNRLTDIVETETISHAVVVDSW